MLNFLLFCALQSSSKLLVVGFSILFLVMKLPLLLVVGSSCSQFATPLALGLNSFCSWLASPFTFRLQLLLFLLKPPFAFGSQLLLLLVCSCSRSQSKLLLLLVSNYSYSKSLTLIGPNLILLTFGLQFFLLLVHNFSCSWFETPIIVGLQLLLVLVKTPLGLSWQLLLFLVGSFSQ